MVGRQIVERSRDLVLIQRLLEASERFHLLVVSLPARIGVREVRDAIGQVRRVLQVQVCEPHVQARRFTFVEPLHREEAPAGLDPTFAEDRRVVERGVESLAVGSLKRLNQLVHLSTRLPAVNPRGRVAPFLIELSGEGPQPRAFAVGADEHGRFGRGLDRNRSVLRAAGGAGRPVLARLLPASRPAAACDAQDSRENHRRRPARFRHASLRGLRQQSRCPRIRVENR